MPRATCRKPAPRSGERDAAIQLALRAAADVPLEVTRLCGRGLPSAKLQKLTRTQDLLVELKAVVEDMTVAFQQLRLATTVCAQTRDEARRSIVRARRTAPWSSAPCPWRFDWLATGPK